jgi:hypothetical protein
MILLVPDCGGIDYADLRLIRLAEFLGIEYRSIQLEPTSGGWAEYLLRVAPDGESCFVVNPRVLRAWTGADAIPESLGAFLAVQYRHLLVHALGPSWFDISILQSLSRGAFRAIREIREQDKSYVVSDAAGDVCESFAGLTFGPTNSNNDRVFEWSREEKRARNLISIGDLPFMCLQESESCKIWFLGSREVVDLEAPIGEETPSRYFSQFVPHAMVLRSVFGHASWHPEGPYASIIIDDPLLQPNYGALNFEALLALMKRHNFFTTLAFIPYNFRRNSARTVRLFRENSDRFALCFHGNDHMGGEFASTDRELLDRLLCIAQRRMRAHRELTGLRCDRVMVFPQGKFSAEAMAAIQAHNFDGAVNTTPHPMREPNCLTLAEVVQPAVLRYGDCPLFLRKPSRQTLSEDVAFNAFFGRPTLIVEHHDVFEDPEQLVQVAARINKTVPEVRWSSVGVALKNSILRKQAPDGVKCIRAYSRTIEITGEPEKEGRYMVEWETSTPFPGRQVFMDGVPIPFPDVESGAVRVPVDVPAGCTRTLSMAWNAVPDKTQSLGLRHNAKAFVRRRLSEIRDNYLSKNPRILATARSMHQHWTHSQPPN